MTACDGSIEQCVISDIPISHSQPVSAFTEKLAKIARRNFKNIHTEVALFKKLGVVRAPA